jgi:hypothetical protein
VHKPKVNAAFEFVSHSSDRDTSRHASCRRTLMCGALGFCIGALNVDMVRNRKDPNG